MFKRLIDKFKCAFVGLIAGLRFDRSILIQGIFALMSVGFFLFIQINAVEWLFVASAIFTVLIAEYLNSAIEDLCDLLVNKYDLHVKEIKDISAAAVLLAAAYALIVAGVILFGRIS